MNNQITTWNEDHTRVEVTCELPTLKTTSPPVVRILSLNRMVIGSNQDVIINNVAHRFDCVIILAWGIKDGKLTLNDWQLEQYSPGIKKSQSGPKFDSDYPSDSARKKFKAALDSFVKPWCEFNSILFAKVNANKCKQTAIQMETAIKDMEEQIKAMRFVHSNTLNMIEAPQDNKDQAAINTCVAVKEQVTRWERLFYQGTFRPESVYGP